MSKSGGVFQIDDVTRTMSKGGCAPGVPPIQVQTPPPTWLAGYGPEMYLWKMLRVSDGDGRVGCVHGGHPGKLWAWSYIGLGIIIGIIL